MRILHISDTHGRHRILGHLPNADVLVHSGDVTDGVTVEELADFIGWLRTLPYCHKVFVAGNHDRCLLHSEEPSGLTDDIHFLGDSAVEIDGLKFYGLTYDHDESLIPSDTDILVTHEPPVMILDLSEGTHWSNATLYRRVMEVSPICHLFGHAHGGYGIVNKNGVIFSNASLPDDNDNLVREQRIIEI